MKPWIVIVMNYSSGINMIALVRATTKSAAQKKGIREYGSGKWYDTAIAFDIGEARKRLEESPKGQDILPLFDC